MPNLVPAPHQSASGRGPTVAVDRRTNRALTSLGQQTVIRAAAVQAHAIVQNEKLHEIDRLTREAMSGQALLNQWAGTLAHGDPFLADELKFFTDVARMGKGEIIADTISDFCQEGRR